MATLQHTSGPPRLCSEIRFGALHLDLVGVSNQLCAQAWFSLQDHIDEVNGLAGLLLLVSSRDLIGVELQDQPMDGDGSHVVWVNRFPTVLRVLR